MKKLLLVDAYALIFRAYFAFIRNPRYTSKGFNTSAILGFTNTLIDLLENESPSHIAIVFDPPGKTFRHDMYKEYKATRPPTPEDIKNAIPYIKKIINGFNIPIVMIDKFEADDVIGTLAHKADENGFLVYLVTPDKDFVQLITPNIKIYKPYKKSSRNKNILELSALKELYGIDDPKQFIEILGLMGDSSDNIPGCPGIGPKTAQKLIQQFNTIEGIYHNIDKLKGKQKESLINNKDKVFLSRKLATIVTEIPIEFNIPSYDKKNISKEKLLPIFKELEFVLLANKVLNLTKEIDEVQGSLFDISEKTKQDEVFNLSSSNCNFYVMDSQDLQADLRADLCIQKRFSYFFLFSDTNPHLTHILGMAFSFDEKNAFYVPFSGSHDFINQILQNFRFIFEDETIVKISHRHKFNIIFLNRHGIKLKGPFFDIALAHYLIHPELNHQARYIAQSMLNYQLVEDIRIDSLSVNNSSEFQKYCCERASIYLKLYQELNKQLLSNQVMKLYTELEIPLLAVLADMEISGVKINTHTLKEIGKKFKEKISNLEKNIFNLASNTSFNISSPKQLGEILFDKLKLDSKAKKTKSGQYSTSEAILMKLKDKHPIIKEILQFRHYTKLLNTYVDTLPTYINENTKNIHTQFVQTEAVTGRLSSKYPNLQNIPIRTTEGRMIRKAFIPSDDEHVLLSADYSQIELRLMAHFSEDVAMIEAFQNNEDIHSSTAAKIHNTSIENVTPQMRYQAKTANFGIIYGISAWGLAERLEISRKEGKILIENYFETYPLVKKFIHNCIKNAREKGFVETIMGRRRYLRDINSKNAFVRGFAERNAVNTPIQGSAADIIKIAMVNIHREIKKVNLKSKMILQVHDELIFDCLKDELQKLKKLVAYEMINAIKLKVPLEIDIDFGNNWLEAH